MDYINLLSDLEVDCLRRVLGCKSLHLFTPTVMVFEHSVLAPHFSISLNPGFCVVESDWCDTPQDWIDYHVMHISLADHPKGVPKVKTAIGTDIMGQPVSSVHRGSYPFDIIKIEVLEYQEHRMNEFVQYDHSILMTFADGSQYIFSAPQSMVPLVGGLEFTGDAAAIEQIIIKLTVRRTVE